MCFEFDSSEFGGSNYHVILSCNTFRGGKRNKQEKMSCILGWTPTSFPGPSPTRDSQQAFYQGRKCNLAFPRLSVSWRQHENDESQREGISRVFSIFVLAVFRATPQVTEHLGEAKCNTVSTFPFYAARHRLTLQRNAVKFEKHPIDQTEQSTR